MSDIRKYTVIESGNVQLGQAGSFLRIGTADTTASDLGNKIVTAITMVEDSTFTTLTPSDSTFIGNSGGSGDNLTTSVTFPAGMTIFGRWSAFRLNSGTVIAYFG